MNSNMHESGCRILFVDDDPSLLHGLRRMLYDKRGQWDMTFSSSPKEALALLNTGAYDLVVSDIQMPAIDGAELLAVTLNIRPETIRFALSDFSNIALILTATGLSHRFIAKPCAPAVLRGVISGALEFLDLLPSRPLRGLVSSLECLPMLPETHSALVEALEAPGDPRGRIRSIAHRDFILSAQILHLANLTACEPEEFELDIDRALKRLKIDFLKSAFLSTQASRTFDEPTMHHFSIREICRHSIQAGRLAAQAARAMGAEPREVEMTAIAGLLHDIGKIVLLVSLPSKYGETCDNARTSSGRAFALAETEMFGAGHEAVGGGLMTLWGMPKDIINAITFHHQSDSLQNTDSMVLKAVRAANDRLHPQPEWNHHNLFTETYTPCSLRPDVHAGSRHLAEANQ